MHIEGQALEGLDSLKGAMEIIRRQGIDASLTPIDTVIG